MSISKLKTLSIAMLLLVNSFFLGIIIVDNYTLARDERKAIENVCSILQSNGIKIDSGNITKTKPIRTMRTARAVEIEANIAKAFLGSTEMTYQGVIYLYENAQRGTAEFYSAGDFEIRLHKGVITGENGMQRTVQDLLRNMRLEAMEFTLVIEPESGKVRALSAYNGISVFNCAIDFIFKENSLQTVRGRYLTGIEAIENGAQISHVTTALLEFLAAVKRGDVECTEITRVQAGYQHNVVGSFGEGVISPVWLVTTVNARYTIDSATREIRML